MIGPIIISVIAVAIIITYVAIVNWFMRQDENYAEGQVTASPQTRTAPVHPHGAILTGS